MGDCDDWRRSRHDAPAGRGNQVPALAGAPVFSVYGVSRIRGQRGRIQGHGYGALRDATVRGRRVEAGTDRTRQIVRVEPGIFLVSLFDDPYLHAEVRGAVWPAAPSRNAVLHGEHGLSGLLRHAS